MYALLPGKLSDANRETLITGCHYDYQDQKWIDGHDHAHIETEDAADFCSVALIGSRAVKGIPNSGHRRANSRQYWRKRSGIRTNLSLGVADMTIMMTEWSTRILSLSDALSVPDGGFSVDPRTGADLRDGYAVAIHPEHERILTHSVTAGDLIEYVAHVADTLAMPGRILGGWRDPNSGSVYLDVSVVTSTLADALSLAVRHNQLAVFDLASMASVPVDMISRVA